jgi:hypothetical protein
MATDGVLRRYHNVVTEIFPSPPQAQGSNFNIVTIAPPRPFQSYPLVSGKSQRGLLFRCSEL